MLILLCIIGIVILFIGYSIEHNHPDYFMYKTFITLLGTLILFISFSSIMVCIPKVLDVNVIDEKITMYQEENKNIEEQINTVLKEFITSETTQSEGLITLISLHPELQSNTLVEQQINTYVANSNKIIELKDQKLTGNVMKWWLYFGA